MLLTTLNDTLGTMQATLLLQGVFQAPSIAAGTPRNFNSLRLGSERVSYRQANMGINRVRWSGLSPIALRREFLLDFGVAHMSLGSTQYNCLCQQWV